MKKNLRLVSQSALSLTALVLAGNAAHAQSDEEGGSWTEGWFVRTGPRLLLNAKASVSLSKPPASPTQYDNGYVQPDSSGGNLTWNWGYSSASQVTGNSLNYTRLDNNAGGTVKDETSDLSVGGEIVIGSELTRFEIGDRVARLGWEVGYGFNPFSIDYSGTATGTASYTQASYDVGGLVVLPQAPYHGTFRGPGPLLNTAPTSSSTINSASSSAFNGSLESDLHNFKLGVWLELPVSKKFLAGVSFGYSSLYADTELTFTENTTYTDLGIPVTGPVTHKVSGRDWNSGIYLEGRFGYQLSRHVSAYVNGGYQYNGEFKFSGAGRNVTMDFTSLFSVGLGVSYRF